MSKAAAYVRSSKDRSDVSLSAQLHELNALATSRGLTIARTYRDAVKSGSTDDRPAFQDLIQDLKNPRRGWSVLLVYDTSRIARGRYIAQAFKHECRRRAVDILYAKVPETDPVSAVILDAVFEAMDEVHSIMSREKGVAGMRENIRRGWRAGGRAPWGYRLHHETTGAVRQGRPVMKSKLVPSEDASTARRFLAARARGVPRAVAARDIEMAVSTLIDIEWNALVYAGHTVWGRHRPKAERGTGRPKRRPRSEWQIQPDTHDALITEAQAEAILAQLETSEIGAAVSRAKAGMSRYLLSGLLQTSDGRRWVAAGRSYRLRSDRGARGRMVPAAALEDAVVQQIRDDFQRPAFVAEFAAAVRRHAAAGPGSLQGLDAEIARLRKQRDRAAKLAISEADGDIFAAMVGDLGRQIEALEREVTASAAEDQVQAELRNLTPTRIREIFLGMESHEALVGALSHITLEPDLSCRLHYGLSMASPGGFEPPLPP